MIESMTGQQFSFIQPKVLSTFTAHQISKIRPQTLKFITADQFKELTPDSLMKMTLEQVEGIPKDILVTISAEQMEKLGVEVSPEDKSARHIFQKDETLAKQLSSDAQAKLNNVQKSFIEAHSTALAVSGGVAVTGAAIGFIYYYFFLIQ